MNDTKWRLERTVGGGGNESARRGKRPPNGQEW